VLAVNLVTVLYSLIESYQLTVWKQQEAAGHVPIRQIFQCMLKFVLHGTIERQGPSVMACNSSLLDCAYEA